jgi:hypothetical protein
MRPMRNRSAALIAAPSLLGGVLAAHALAYRWTVPAAERASVLRQAGHAWEAYLPFLIAPALALLAIGLLRHTVSRSARPAAWPFAVLPPFAFLLQEQLERFFHDGTPHLVLTTPVLAGVLLAVPFGLTAYAVARALLGLSESAARAFAARPPRLVAAASYALAAPRSLAAAVVVGSRPGRGPPRAR